MPRVTAGRGVRLGGEQWREDDRVGRLTVQRGDDGGAQRTGVPIEAVDIAGTIMRGTLERGMNPVGVTLELIVERTDT